MNTTLLLLFLQYTCMDTFQQGAINAAFVLFRKTLANLNEVYHCSGFNQWPMTCGSHTFANNICVLQSIMMEQFTQFLKAKEKSNKYVLKYNLINISSTVTLMKTKSKFNS